MSNFLNFNEPIVIGSLPADPANPVQGLLYYNTTTNTVRMYQNSAWSPVDKVGILAAGSVPFSNGTALTADNQLLYSSSSHTLTIGDTTPYSSGKLYLLNQTSAQSNLRLDTYGGISAIDFGYANGTKASPTAVNADDTLLSLRAFGHNGVGLLGTSSGEISLRALSSWNTSSTPTYFLVKTTDSSDTLKKTSLQLNDSTLALGSGYLGAQFSTELSGGNFTIKTSDVYSTGSLSPVTNGPSSSLSIQTGASTGTGIGGEIIFSISAAGLTSGTTANTPSEILRVRNTGAIKLSGLSADPGSASSGDIYYNSSTNSYKYYNGSAWSALGGSGANTTLSNLASITSVSSSLIPSNNNTLALGSNISSWSIAYVNEIQLGNNNAFAVLDYVDSVNMIANTSSYTTFLNYNASSFEGAILTYKAKDTGTLVTRVGQIYICNSTSDASIVEYSVDIGAVGLAFNAIINGSNVSVQYTNSNSNNVLMKYTITKFSA